MPRFSRRALLIGGMSGLAAPAVGQSPPRFGTASHQFTELSPPRRFPTLKLLAVDGVERVLAPATSGVTLVNFWATWCPACVTELPTLQRLSQSKVARVLTIAVDRERGRAHVAQYLKKLNITELPVFVDPLGIAAYVDRDNARSAPFALYGMPISYLVDRSQQVVGYFPGEADWLSPSARQLFDHYGR